MGNLIEKAIYSGMSTASALTAVVSTRIHEGRLPQNPVYPALTYFIVDDPLDPTHDSKFGPGRARFQVSAWAKTYPAMRSLGELVTVYWLGQRGTLASIRVDGVFLEDRFPLYEPDQEIEVYQYVTDWRIHYKW